MATHARPGRDPHGKRPREKPRALVQEQLTRRPPVPPKPKRWQSPVFPWISP